MPVDIEALEAAPSTKIGTEHETLILPSGGLLDD
jgi:hypothetical protein